MPVNKCYSCENWTTWVAWTGYRWVPRCFDCGKKLGRPEKQKEGGDKNELDADLQSQGNPNS
jgi:hypothetical protein